MNKVKQSKFAEWCKVGTTHQTNFNGECEVVAYRSSTDIDVMFKDGTIVNTKSGNLKKGVVKNPNQPKIFGVAINDIPNSTNTKLYQIWHSMVRRCYSEVYQNSKPIYKGVTMQESWLLFSNFKRDAEQTPFSSYCETHGYELDKDVLSGGSREYRLNSISFIPREINSVLIKDIRFGVYKGYYINNDGYYAPSTKGVVDKIRKRLGYKTSYRTQEEALSVYKECKKVQLKDLAEKYKGEVDNRVYEKLINYNFELENSD